MVQRVLGIAPITVRSMVVQPCARDPRPGSVRIPCLRLASWMAGHPSDRGPLDELRLRIADWRSSCADSARLNANLHRGITHRRIMDPSSASNGTDVTLLLQRWSGGDQRALDRLMPLVYDELRGVAHRRLKAERTGHTLQTADLVHEAYARMADADLDLKNRAHFFALAARTMRRILVDYARAKTAEKRGGGAGALPIHELTVQVADDDAETETAEILALHAALEKLEAQDPRKAQVIEAHIFGGLTYDETAEVVGISAATVDRDLRMAKAWLARELGRP